MNAVNNATTPAQVEPSSEWMGLRVTELSVTQQRNQPILRQISFDVASHEIVALTGPSGSGKSTLLRAIAGLEQLTSGSVQWRGNDITRQAPHKRGFGLMFQDGQLFGHMSVEKNIAYGLATQRVPKTQQRERVAEMLELVGLSGFAGRSVTELSGGEQQRVALARSLAPKPSLLMLDEPLSSLDRGLRDRLAAEISTLLRRTQTTAIMVTHDLAEAETVADRVLRLEEGRITA